MYISLNLQVSKLKNWTPCIYVNWHLCLKYHIPVTKWNHRLAYIDRCIRLYIIYDSDDDDEIKQKFENTFNRSIINDLKCWNQLLLFTVAPKRYVVCCHRDIRVTPSMVQMDGFTRLPPPPIHNIHTHTYIYFVIRYIRLRTSISGKENLR